MNKKWMMVAVYSVVVVAWFGYATANGIDMLAFSKSTHWSASGPSTFGHGTHGGHSGYGGFGSSGGFGHK